MKREKQILFDFIDTNEVMVGVDIDKSFNNGEVPTGEPWEDNWGLETINWGVESILVLCEESKISLPISGIHHFRANGITYEMVIKKSIHGCGDITSVTKVK